MIQFYPTLDKYRCSMTIHKGNERLDHDSDSCGSEWQKKKI